MKATSKFFNAKASLMARVFEMLYIKRLKLNLNVQVDSILAKLFVWISRYFVFVTFLNYIFF